MTDTRQHLSKAAGSLAGLATQAAYVAIGVGVLEFQKAQVYRQKASEALGARTDGARELDAKLSRVVKLVDDTFDPLVEKMPAATQALVHRARDTRDQIRKLVLGAA
ncbi:MAG: hypothetical protein ABR925_00570 [Acidimicrobiales bacterium]|jgi:hypothetical protein